MNASSVSTQKIINLHWHDLRHTFGTRLAEAGCREATIADLMGHSDPQTTRRYTHATDRTKRAAVEVVRLKLCHKTRTATFAASRKCLARHTLGRDFGKDPLSYQDASPSISFDLQAQNGFTCLTCKVALVKNLRRNKQHAS